MRIIFFFSANFIVVPGAVIMFLFAYYDDKVGKIQRRFLWFYVLHLVLLHVSLVFTQMIRFEMYQAQHVTELFAFVSYYSLISCFAWIYVLCDNVLPTLELYRPTSDIAFDENMQDVFEVEKILRLRFYWFCGHISPLLMTTFAVTASVVLLKLKEFPWVSTNSIKVSHFNLFFLPITLLMTYGLFQFAKIGRMIFKMNMEVMRGRTRKRVELERKRFVFDSENLK